jgi:hypothetical protein
VCRVSWTPWRPRLKELERRVLDLGDLWALSFIGIMCARGSTSKVTSNAVVECLARCVMCATLGLAIELESLPAASKFGVRSDDSVVF